MRKRSVIILCPLLILLLWITFFNEYRTNFLQKKIIDLTSMMVPFERMERKATLYCSELTLQDRYQLEFEQLSHYRLAQSYEQPSINTFSGESPSSKLPYFYSFWKTSSLLPRLMTPCEHQLYIHLLKQFDEICRKNDVEYMISHGTLLGSYRNHGKNFRRYCACLIAREAMDVFQSRIAKRYLGLCRNRATIQNAFRTHTSKD